MREIPLQDAEVNLSTLVDDAKRGEACIITRDGEPQAVLIGMADWQRLSKVPTFAQWLMAAPLEPGDLAERGR